jgi:hypothetical protein
MMTQAISQNSTNLDNSHSRPGSQIISEEEIITNLSKSPDESIEEAQSSFVQSIKKEKSKLKL